MSAFTYAQKHDFGINQSFVNRYHKLVSEALKDKSNDLASEFSELKTDVERVNYFVEILRAAHDGKSLDDIFSKNYVKLLLKSENGKRDDVSTIYLQHGLESRRKNDLYMALYDLTKAVFHAASKEQLALSFTERSDMLSYLGLYKEAKRDAKEALRVSDCNDFFADERILAGALNLKIRKVKAKAGIALGRCYKYLNQTNKAIKEFERTQKFLKTCLTLEEEALRHSAVIAHVQCKTPRKFEQVDRFVRHQPNLNKFEPSESSLLFKNAGPEKGWTTVVTRDFAPCDIIAKSEPTGLVLSNNKTKYCYSCFRRCHNLLPCKNCAQVGFCSKKCVRRAGRNRRKGDFYPNRHQYDCNDILPVVINCMNAKDSKSAIRIYNTAFTCVANTEPRRLLEFICSTRKYKGKGHPAFYGIEEVRKTAPPLWNTSDYASIAWLSSCSDELNTVKGTYGTLLLDFTIASVLLAYCLHLGDYPMDWNYSKQIDLSKRFSGKPPANWIAACLLYHIQSTRLNAFAFCERIKANEEYKVDELAGPLYPPFSLINHSCDPSAVFISSTNGVALLMALKDLKAGSEISITYCDMYDACDTQDRRESLRNAYFFECQCEACENGWNEDNPVEKIKCPGCNFGSEFTQDFCSNCNSKLPIEAAEKVIDESLSFQYNSPYLKWTDASVYRLSYLISEVQALLSPPNQVAGMLREILFKMVIQNMQLWTYEAWIPNYFGRHQLARSPDDREQRHLILD